MPLVLFFRSAHTVGEWAVVYLPIKSDTNPSEAWYAIPTASSSCLAIIFTGFSMLLTQFLNLLVSPVNLEIALSQCVLPYIPEIPASWDNC